MSAIIENYDKRLYKKCIKCRKWKPRADITTETGEILKKAFGNHSTSCDGLQSICYTCKNAANNDARNRNVTARIRHHTATRCLAQLGNSAPEGFVANLEEFLGYTIRKLVKHLSADLKEREGSKRKLRDALNEGYHIDHKKPLSSFHVLQDGKINWDNFRECWAMENLTAIPAAENLAKGAKYDPPEASHVPEAQAIPSGVQCFFCVPTDRQRTYLRRYEHKNECPNGYHEAKTYIGDRLVPDSSEASSHEQVPHDDPRWPTKCEHCDYLFTDTDHWQFYDRRIYIRQDTGEEVTLWDKIPGMMWDAAWYDQKGPDGRALIVVCPDGLEWCIDGPARNCRRPNDHNHNCWSRTGEVPNITVGLGSCGTGGGSIQTNHGYHGHLINGRFKP